MNKEEKAFELLDEAIFINPNDFESFKKYGLIYLNRINKDEFLKLYHKMNNTNKELAETIFKEIQKI